MKKCIILANGNPPKKNVLTFLKSKGYSKIICADGGANHIRKLSIIPDYIIGDLDSITPENLKYYSGKSIISKISRQNDTDVEKCLKFAIQKKYTDCILLGVTGNRLDHSFCNLGIAIKFSDKIDIKIISENSYLSVHSGAAEVTTCPGEVFSIYGFDDNTLITSIGLKYKLNKTSLPFGKRESTSNVAEGDKVTLTIENGKVFIIRDFQTVKKYGFI